MGSHSVTCEHAPPSPQPVGRYSIYLPRRYGRLSWPRLPGNAPAGNRTRDLSIINPTPYHYTNRATQCLRICGQTEKRTDINSERLTVIDISLQRTIQPDANMAAYLPHDNWPHKVRKIWSFTAIKTAPRLLELLVQMVDRGQYAVGL